MMKKFMFGAIFFLMLVSLAISVVAQPAITAIGAKTVNEGSPLTFSVTVTAPSSGTVNNFTICDAGSATGVCAGTHINGFSTITLGSVTANITNISNTQGQFNWTPSFSASGTYYIRFNVSDADSSAAEVVTINVVDVAPTLTVGDLTLGGKSQERSNPRHDELNKRNVNVTGTITVTNSGSESVSSLSGVVSLGIDSNGMGISLSDIISKITIPTEGQTLSAGESTTVTVEMRVPEELDAVNNKGVAKAFDIAQITFTATRSQSTATISSISKVKMQAENRLEIKDANIKFGDSKKDISDGDNVKKVRPGDDVTIDFEIENKFKDEEDVEIQDIEISVENDDDLDIDEEESVNDLSPGDRDTVTIQFEIDEDVDKGDEDLEITLLGEDQNGARHGEEWTVTLEIEREDHELDIRSLDLSPTIVTCESEAQVTVEIRNTGRRDEEKSYIRVDAPTLKYTKVSEKLSLDEDDELSKTFVIPIPKDLAEGTYRIAIETLYNTNVKSMADAVVLRKSDCSPVQDIEPTPTEPIIPNDIVVTTIPTVTQQDNSKVVDSTAVPVQEESFFQSSGFIVLLVLGYIVALGGGAVVAIKLLRK